MTKVYFIRHAQSDFTVSNSRIRPLTEKGRNDCRLVTEFLSDKNIDMVFSSPFKRAVDTLANFAEINNFEIQTIEDFREYRGDSTAKIDRNAKYFSDNNDFSLFLEKQWADFSYKISDGECLAEIQERNITALKELLIEHKEKNIVIGTHGIALSTIINYYDSTFGFKNFLEMADIMPWVVKMAFDENSCVKIEKIDLLMEVK